MKIISRLSLRRRPDVSIITILGQSLDPAGGLYDPGDQDNGGQREEGGQNGNWHMVDDS